MLNKHLLAIFAFETDRINTIIDTEHRDCHFGIVKMISIINQKYYGISKKSITIYVNTCESCSNFVPLWTINDMNLVQTTKNMTDTVCAKKTHP